MVLQPTVPILVTEWPPGMPPVAAAVVPISCEQALDLAQANIDIGRPAPAEALCRRVLGVVPRSARAFYLMGTMALNARNLKAAGDLMRWSIDCEPDNGRAFIGLAIVERFLGNFSRSLELLEFLAAQAPDMGAIHGHMSATLERLRNMPRAIAAARRGIELDPSNSGLHISLAVQLLHVGQWDEGWYEYEWRWLDSRIGSDHKALVYPWWDGSKTSGKTILLFGEQGYGDTLLASRYLPLIAERGLRVVVRCQEALARLLARMPGVSAVVAAPLEAGTIDYQLPMLSAPRVFGTRPDCVPGQVPYISADAGLIGQWGARMGEMESSLAPGATSATTGGQAGGHRSVKAGRSFRVGLAWSGNPMQDDNPFRSMPLRAFAPLADVPGVVFYSLEKEGSGLEAEQPPPGMRLVPIAAQLRDFADTAAVIANLDLVISIDSAPAHLAGAMGKPLWVPLCVCSSWQWLSDGQSSVWYPTARLFRQAELFDWQPVAQRMAEGLRELISTPGT